MLVWPSSEVFRFQSYSVYSNPFLDFRLGLVSVQVSVVVEEVDSRPNLSSLRLQTHVSA